MLNQLVLLLVVITAHLWLCPAPVHARTKINPAADEENNAYRSMYMLTDAKDDRSIDYYSFGNAGNLISADQQHIVVLEARADNRIGKGIIFSETTLGAKDWNNNQLELRDPSGVVGDEFAVTGVMSSDSSHVILCTYEWNAFQGKCIVFSETSSNSRDWNETVTPLIDAVGQSLTLFGIEPPAISDDAQHIVICEKDHDFQRGKCIVFMESAIGARDWNDQQITLVHGGEAIDELGDYSPLMSADAQLIFSCAPKTNDGQGSCFVFAESALGANDWQNNLIKLEDDSYNATASTAWLGMNGYVASANLQHIVVCTRRLTAQGKCVVFSESAPGQRDWNETKQVVLTDVTADPTVRDKLGYEGVALSADTEHIVLCTAEYNSRQGKCIVFSESTPGSQDWNNTQTTLVDAGYQETQHGELGHGGPPAISSDSRRITACNSYGGCIIFSETSLGSRDWYNNQLFLTESIAGDFAGNGAFFLPDDVIFSCSEGVPSLSIQPACFLFTVDYVNQCESSPCVNGGVCADDLLNFTCSCPAGTTGFKCEIDIDECESSPCLNSGTCTDGDVFNSVNCSCIQGFEGDVCELDVNDCISNPCATGNCSDDGFVPNTFNCTCFPGYTGVLCDEDIDECGSTPCANNGTCADDVNVPTAFNCTCVQGYSGTLCDEDFDDCISNPCLNNGACIDDGVVANNFSCICVEGYEGNFCELDIDDCASAPCIAGNCTDTGLVPNLFNCTCTAGVRGQTCDVDIDDCASAPCQHDGLCSDDGSIQEAYNCTCLAGWTGPSCEHAIVVAVDVCSPSPCSNNGSCVSLSDEDFECVCPVDSYAVGPLCNLTLLDRTQSYFVLVLTMNVSSIELVNTTVADYVLMEFLALQPKSVAEQYNVTVVTILLTEKDGLYEVTVGILSTDVADGGTIVTSIETAGNPWTVGSPLEDDDTLDEDPETAEIPLLFLIVAALIVLSVLLLGIILMLYRKRYKRVLMNPEGEEYVMPT